MLVQRCSWVPSGVKLVFAKHSEQLATISRPDWVLKAAWGRDAALGQGQTSVGLQTTGLRLLKIHENRWCIWFTHYTAKGQALRWYWDVQGRLSHPPKQNSQFSVNFNYEFSLSNNLLPVSDYSCSYIWEVELFLTGHN